jgi:uncharacterized membrane protein
MLIVKTITHRILMITSGLIITKVFHIETVKSLQIVVTLTIVNSALYFFHEKLWRLK